MWLIVGLGNIGGNYTNTYHNLGFMVADKVAKKMGLKFDTEKCKSMLAKGEYMGEEVIIAKPTTFMNRSGQAVLELCKKYKIKKGQLIVALDDIDLPRGKVRFREQGSAGTHNGLRSVVEMLATTDFPRVRVGTGRDENMQLIDFVVSKIPYEYRDVFDSATDEACDIIVSKVKGE